MPKGNTAVMVTESLNNENQHTLKYFLQKIRKKIKPDAFLQDLRQQKYGKLG